MASGVFVVAGDWWIGKESKFRWASGQEDKETVWLMERWMMSGLRLPGQSRR